MRHIILGVVAILLLTTVSLAQDAPTEEQCEANLNLWLIMSDTSTLSATELLRRADSLAVCVMARPSNPKVVSYVTLSASYTTVHRTRITEFWKRHLDLYQQFLNEDALGLGREKPEKRP